MPKPISVAVAAGLVLATLTPAQRTWVVDHAGGPGVDFRNLPPAVLAAAAGDTIRVAGGSYTGFTTDKGLRILGAPDTVIGDQFASPIVVHDLPADEVFVLERCNFLAALGVGRIELRRNLGAVHLEHQAAAERLVVEACRHVTLNNLVLGHVDVVDSTVDFAGVSAQGKGVVGAFTPTIAATRSTLRLTASTVRGPDYAGGIGPFDTLNGPAAHLDASRLVVSAGSQLSAGFPGPSGYAMSALEATGSTIELDQGAAVVGQLGAPPIVSDRPVTTVEIPALLAEGGGPGGALAIGLWSPANTPALIALSAPTRPYTLPPFGELALDPASLAIVSTATVPPSGLLVVHVPIPAHESVRGTPLTAQALAVLPTGLRACGSATVVLH